MRATTGSRVTHTIGRVKELWAEFDDAQRRLLEVRMGVPRVHAGHTLRARPVVPVLVLAIASGLLMLPDDHALATDRLSRRGPHRVRAGPHSPAGAASVAGSADAVSVLPIGGTPMAAAITRQLLEIRPLPEIVEGPTIPRQGCALIGVVPSVSVSELQNSAVLGFDCHTGQKLRGL